MKLKIFLTPLVFIILVSCSLNTNEEVVEDNQDTTTTVSTTTSIPIQESTTTSIIEEKCIGDNNQNINFEKVQNIQLFLNKYGFNAGNPDGYLGNQTINAIREFQSYAGLYPDGDAGPNTIQAMKNWTGCEQKATSITNTTTTTVPPSTSDEETSTATTTSTTTTTVIATTQPNEVIKYGYAASVSVVDNNIQTIFKGINNSASICGTPYLNSLETGVINQFVNPVVDYKNLLSNTFGNSSASTEIKSITNSEIIIHVDGNGDENFNFYFISPFNSKLISLPPDSIEITPGLTKAIFSKQNLKSGYWFYSFAENGSGEIVKSSGLREFSVDPSVDQYVDSPENIEAFFLTKNGKSIAYGESLSINDSVKISYLTDKVYDKKDDTTSLIEDDDKLITLSNGEQANQNELLLIDKELVLIKSKEVDKYTIERGYLNTVPKDHEPGVSVKSIKKITESSIVSNFAYAVFRTENGLRFQVPLDSELNVKEFSLLGCPNGRYSLEEITTFAWRQQGSSVVASSTNQNLNTALLNKEFIITDSPINYEAPVLQGTDSSTGSFINDGPRNLTISLGDDVEFNFSGLKSNSSIIKFVKLNFQMSPLNNSKLTSKKSIFFNVVNDDYKFFIKFNNLVNSKSHLDDVWERGYKYIFTGIEVFDKISKTTFNNDGTIDYDSKNEKSQHNAYYLDQFSFLVPNE